MKNKTYFIFVLSCFLLFILSFNFFQSRRPFSESEVIKITNEARKQAGLPALSPDQRLAAAARDKLHDMKLREYFSHQAPDGEQPWGWFEKNGYLFVYAGENLAVNFTDAESLIQAWLASPSHKKNLLNPEFKNIGVSVENIKIDGKKYAVVVQLLGTPKTLTLK